MVITWNIVKSSATAYAISPSNTYSTWLVFCLLKDQRAWIGAWKWERRKWDWRPTLNKMSVYIEWFLLFFLHFGIMCGAVRCTMPVGRKQLFEINLAWCRLLIVISKATSKQVYVNSHQKFILCKASLVRVQYMQIMGLPLLSTNSLYIGTSRIPLCVFEHPRFADTSLLCSETGEDDVRWGVC